MKIIDEVSKESIQFLNLVIHKGERFKSTGNLDIKCHTRKQKPFNTYTEHPATPSQPSRLFKGRVNQKKKKKQQQQQQQQQQQNQQQRYFCRKTKFLHRETNKTRGSQTKIKKTQKGKFFFKKTIIFLFMKNQSQQKYR